MGTGKQNDFDRVIEKLKAGDLPAEEDREVVRRALVELGEVFESIRMHATVSVDVFRKIWESYVSTLPDGYLEQINQQLEERAEEADASRAKEEADASC